ncbi:SH3 domain-containing protein [Rhizobium sp. YIM 134829]|uniref:SH3 domain-containing protein n=1 Tax=Rhizobium sp. YIM 134829 TaxID=3390453 RepID=UPI00397D874A
MKAILSGAALAAALFLPVVAEAAEGYSTANVNMRSGPSTAYPAVVVIPAGTSVEIHGCLSTANWCDVSFYSGRGWVSASYLQTVYRTNRVVLAPQYYQPLGIPTVTFEIDNYWDRHYRNRTFYRDRDVWRRDVYRRDSYRDDRAPGRYIREREDRRDRFEDDRDRLRDQAERDRQRQEAIRERRRDIQAEERQRIDELRDRRRDREERIENRREERIDNRREERQDRRERIERRENTDALQDRPRRRAVCGPNDENCSNSR